MCMLQLGKVTEGFRVSQSLVAKCHVLDSSHILDDHVAESVKVVRISIKRHLSEIKRFLVTTANLADN